MPGFGAFKSDQGFEALGQTPQRNYVGSMKQGLAASRAQAFLKQSQIKADATREIAEAQAEGIRAGGQASAQATMGSAIGGAIGSVGSGLIGAFCGGGGGGGGSSFGGGYQAQFSSPSYFSPSIGSGIGSMYETSNAPDWPTQTLNWRS